jgi:NADPH:quinone reductase-like Zn-dependent oxidoreductase
VLRPAGRLVSVAEEPPLALLSNPAISARYFIVKPSREQLIRLTTLIDDGQIRPTVGEVFVLADAPEAFARAMAGNTGGKVVLRVAEA